MLRYLSSLNQYDVKLVSWSIHDGGPPWTRGRSPNLLVNKLKSAVAVYVVACGSGFVEFEKFLYIYATKLVFFNMHKTAEDAHPNTDFWMYVQDRSKQPILEDLICKRRDKLNKNFVFNALLIYPIFAPFAFLYHGKHNPVCSFFKLEQLDR